LEVRVCHKELGGTKVKADNVKALVEAEVAEVDRVQLETASAPAAAPGPLISPAPRV
jgi:hypothetical protein